VNTIASVYQYADILRASIAHAGNDHRLGANEAPPAIISVFIGEAMTNLLDQIANSQDQGGQEVMRALDLISKLPNLELDNTDRNRTSPFAFTGNKFEIRAVGSSQNCAGPMAVMNAMMGLQLVEFQQEVEKRVATGETQDVAILAVLKALIRKSKAICFEGNNYSDEWKEEAQKRGLNNFATTPEALDVLGKTLAQDLYGKSGVMNTVELEAYHLVQLHGYVTKLDIESKTLEELINSFVIPATLRYQKELADNVSALRSIDMVQSAKLQIELLRRVSTNLEAIHTGLKKLHEAYEKAHKAESLRDEADVFCHQVRPQMEAIRDAADDLEAIVDDQYWPLVKYRELLFIR
jgi:glutamine synthetase